jgi:predicted esterase
MLWIIGGLLLWISAVALFLMACAIPASWIPTGGNREARATPTALAAATVVNPPPWTVAPSLPAPVATATGVVDPFPVATPTDAQVILPPAPTVAPIAQGGDGQAVAPPLVQTGTLVDIQYVDSYGTAAIDDLSRTFYPETNFVPARYIVDRYQIRFQTLDQWHQLNTIRAELFIPHVEAPTEFPLFVYGSGTTGIGNDCAPLDELTRGRNWGSYRTHMLSYATQGYLAVLPLWQGYDDLARTHPYFIAELEGEVMLDAARAVLRFFGSTPTVQARPAAAVFFAGYSQGSHGAFAADTMAPAYASELPIKGVIGHAGAPNVEALLREAPSLAPYIVYAFRDYYGPDVITPAQVFQDPWLPSFDTDASTKCVDEIYDYYHGGQGNIYRPDFSQSLYGGRLGFDIPNFKAALDRNDVGRSVNPQVPALLLHGSADPIVTPQTNDAFMRQLCQQGKPVTYYLYNNVHHFQTRQYSFVDTLNWMQAILTGAPVRSDCATILAR